MNRRPRLPPAPVRIAMLAFTGLGALAQPVVPPAAPPRPHALIADLGCANCHTELRIRNSLREHTPNLGSAGSRYNPAYLFDFLQNPAKVRQHLGAARMPNFHLNPKEALALTVFLADQRQRPTDSPELPREIFSARAAMPQGFTKQDVHAEIATGLACLTCHTFDGRGGTQAVDLATISFRLQPEWVKEFLAAPSRFGVPAATMPEQFYQMARDGKRFEEMLPQPAQRIQRVTEQLFSLNADKRTALERRLELARASYPDANAWLGEKIFRALNCAACHRHPTISPRENAGPDLTSEGQRVNPAWLQRYLKHPVAIRPFGYRPGDGSRMPNFRLSDGEAATLGGYLLTQSEGKPAIVRDFEPRNLSAFAKAKAKSLLEQKLSCLGCHRLGEGGGRIGPDLAQVRARLRPEYVYSIIKDPRAVVPHSMMPRVPLTSESVHLLANFLLQQETPAQAEGCLSPAEYALIPFEPTPPGAGATVGARQMYLGHCAACHGSEGRGDGFNARFLPVKPTVHADPAYLSKRPNDTLYDGVHSGGYVLNKSPMMPPWGETFAPAEDWRRW